MSTNRYASVCRICGMPVPAGDGILERYDGRWAVLHLDGDCATEREGTRTLYAPVGPGYPVWEAGETVRTRDGWITVLTVGHIIEPDGAQLRAYLVKDADEVDVAVGAMFDSEVLW